ncbi:MAG: Jag N-terminal domain-containing protein [Oscillospiraceae bacterium]|nr:Jag N-terminal domain-containing protein [Candidatus Limimonas coprohippi]MCQ2488377.1 Jag N-terminal domain-containing protein [Clostridia bacterium]
MIKEATAVAATIEEAQQAAALALNAPEKADVHFEVITMPEKKVLGLFGGKQAEVRAYYEAPDEKPAKKAAKKNEKKNVSKAEVATEKKEEPVVEAEVVELANCPENVKKAYEYLNTIIAGIGVEGTKIEVSRCEKDYFFSITSEEDYSLLIGRRGETLDSIQYLVRLVANKKKNDAEFSKISINVGNYREKREATLKDIARRTASKVKKYGRNIALDPMNPFERRVIHTEVAKIPDVTSYSVGSDADRKVVITLEEGAKPTNPRKSYGNNRGGGRGRDRAPSHKIEAPDRAPRADASGVRYGKILPKTESEE